MDGGSTQIRDDAFVEANLSPTAILDYEHPAVRALVTEVDPRPEETPRQVLQRAHRLLQARLKPVYSLLELQSVSTTLTEGRGACSQRMACLEAVARAVGVPTRVRALWIDGRFWYPRFGLARIFIPGRILLAWPQLWLEGRWTDVDELFAPTAALVARSEGGFRNDGETLFDAVEHTAVDFIGKSRVCGPVCTTGGFDLSKWVLADDGFFDSRDALFARFGSLQHSLTGRAFALLFGGRESWPTAAPPDTMHRAG